MLYTWIDRVCAVLRYFPDFKDPNERRPNKSRDDIVWETPLHCILWTWGGMSLRHEMLQIVLDAGANPNAPCLCGRDDAGEHYWTPLELVQDDEDARLLLDAGAVVPRSYKTMLGWNARGARCILEFSRNSFRATAVVWCCCDALRGTSSWPDVAFLLTKIMMDVSK